MRLNERRVVLLYRHVTRLTTSRLIVHNLPFRRINPLARYLTASAWRADAHSTNGETCQPQTLPVSQIDSIIREAGPYGIHSLEQLDFEATVGHSNKVGTRMTDRPEYRNNLELWGILLAYQQTANGSTGVRTIWRGMRYRGPQVRLMEHDPYCQPIWEAFLRAGMESLPFLDQMCRDAVTERIMTSTLFVDVVGSLLAHGQGAIAMRKAQFLQSSSLDIRSDILRLIEATCRLQDSTAVAQLCDVLIALRDRCRVYDDAIAIVWEHGTAMDAFLLHEFLLSESDLPTDFSSLKPFLRHMANSGEGLDQFIHTLEIAGVSFTAQAKRYYAQERSRTVGVSSESLNILASRTLGMQPQTMSDEFIARAFATNAFAFDFILSSLRLLGLIEVGPLSVRQMALSSPDMATLKTRFERLEQFEVDTGSSTLVRVVKKLCQSDNFSLLHDVIHSDQHHDCFEDQILQKRLLAEYLHVKDWSKVNSTLAILNHGKIGREVHQTSNNMLLEAAVAIADWHTVIETLTNIRRHSHKITETILHKSRDALLSVKAQSPDQSQMEFDRVGLLIAIWQQGLLIGTYLPIRFWSSPIFLLGQAARFDELETLLLWLLEWYFPSTTKDHGSSSGAVDEYRYKINEFIDEKLQRSLITWSLSNDVPKTSKNLETSFVEAKLRGLLFLKTLHSKYDVHLHLGVIRRSFLICMRQLYALDVVSQKRQNRISRHYNKGRLDDYVKRFNQVWDGIVSITYDEALRFVLLRLDELKKEENQGESQPDNTSSSPIQEMNSAINDDVGSVPPNETVADEGDVVIYSDLFHPSWKDYKDREKQED